MITVGLTKSDSETIGFVVASLFATAIDISELREWALLTVGDLDTSEAPAYLFDLIDFNEPLSSIYRVIGFTPVWNRSEAEELALLGLAMKRGKQVYDLPVSPDEALRQLVENPQIQDKFRKIFPFISF